MRIYTHEKLLITIEELQNTTFIKEVWSGVLTTTIFRSLINKSLEIYRDKIPELKGDRESFLLLADITKLELITANDINWLSKDINPQYSQIGFTDQALITPKSKNAQNIVSKYEGEMGGIKTKIFVEELSAVRWFFNRDA